MKPVSLLVVVALGERTPGLCPGAGRGRWVQVGSPDTLAPLTRADLPQAWRAASPPDPR